MIQKKTVKKSIMVNGQIDWGERLRPKEPKKIFSFAYYFLCYKDQIVYLCWAWVINSQGTKKGNQS